MTCDTHGGEHLISDAQLPRQLFLRNRGGSSIQEENRRWSNQDVGITCRGKLPWRFTWNRCRQPEWKTALKCYLVLQPDLAWTSSCNQEANRKKELVLVESCEGSEIWSYSQAHKLDNCNLMDAGRRHKTHGLETKGNWTQAKESAFAPAPWAPVPTGQHKEWLSEYAVGSVIGQELCV